MVSVYKKREVIDPTMLHSGVHFYLLDMYLLYVSTNLFKCLPFNAYWKSFVGFPGWVAADLQLFHSLPLNASYIGIY